MWGNVLPMTSAAQLESAVESRFRRAVSRLGGMTDKLASTRAGIPDRLVLLPGGVVELVELKAVGGVLRPVQRAYHHRCARLGTQVTVLTGAAEVDAWEAERRVQLALRPAAS